jgi:hypothetical protein
VVLCSLLWSQYSFSTLTLFGPSFPLEFPPHHSQVQAAVGHLELLLLARQLGTPSLGAMSTSGGMHQWTVNRGLLGGEATTASQGLRQTRVRIEVHAEHDRMSSPHRIDARRLYGNLHVMHLEGILISHDGRNVVTRGLLHQGFYPDFDEAIRTTLVSFLVQVGLGHNDLCVDVTCKKGRHRSMMFGWTLGRLAASMGLEVTMAVPATLDHKGRSRLCSDPLCAHCHALGGVHMPSLSYGEENFVDWLTQTFMRTDGSEETREVLATAIEEWDFGPWGSATWDYLDVDPLPG